METGQKRKLLVADSGSTKTAWMVVDMVNGSVQNSLPLFTQGLNPYQQNEEEMEYILSQELLPNLNEDDVTHVFFYGAGCTSDKVSLVASALRRTIASNARICVGSDMLGAAKAMAQKQEAVVCILGTGANSCLYDGNCIVANVPPLGYVLGDEGSGAYIGKRLVADCLKGQFSKEISDMFFAETHLTPSAVIQKTYREAMPNRFLASLSPFCARHREMKEIKLFLADCFMQFVRRNVLLYERPDLPVHFVGSVAWFYRDEVRLAVEQEGLKMGEVCQAPLERLTAYYTTHLS